MDESTELVPESRTMMDDLVRHMKDSWPPEDARDPSFAISAAAEDMANHWRVNGTSARQHLLQYKDIAGKTVQLDIFTDDGLDVLLGFLHKDISGEPGAVTSNVGPEYVLATVFVAAHTAIYASNWQGLEAALDWVDSTLATGFKRKDYFALKIVGSFMNFGYARESTVRPMNGQQQRNMHGPPSLEELKTFYNQIISVTSNLDDNFPDSNDNQRLRLRMLLNVVDSVNVMPSAWLMDEGADYAHWVIDVCGRELELEPGQTHQVKARLSLIVSDMYYALEDMVAARKSVMHALQATHGKDEMFTQQCQNVLNFLEREDASRNTNEARISKEVTAEVTKKAERQIDVKVQETKRDSAALLDQTQKQMELAIQTEIKDALLRVVEILGVFIAIVAIAITAVGGIAAGQGALQTFIIFGSGFGSIVLLMVLLKLIVDGSLNIRFTRDPKRQLNAAAQQTGAEEAVNEGQNGGV